MLALFASADLEEEEEAGAGAGGGVSLLKRVFDADWGFAVGLGGAGGVGLIALALGLATGVRTGEGLPAGEGVAVAAGAGAAAGVLGGAVGVVVTAFPAKEPDLGRFDDGGEGKTVDLATVGGEEGEGEDDDEEEDEDEEEEACGIRNLDPLVDMVETLLALLLLLAERVRVGGSFTLFIASSRFWSSLPLAGEVFISGLAAAGVLGLCNLEGGLIPESRLRVSTRDALRIQRVPSSTVERLRATSVVSTDSTSISTLFCSWRLFRLSAEICLVRVSRLFIAAILASVAEAALWATSWARSRSATSRDGASSSSSSLLEGGAGGTGGEAKVMEDLLPSTLGVVETETILPLEGFLLEGLGVLAATAGVFGFTTRPCTPNKINASSFLRYGSRNAALRETAVV